MLLANLMTTGGAMLTGTIYLFGRLHRDDRVLYVEGLADDMSR